MVGVNIRPSSLLFAGSLIPTLFALAGCGGSGLATVEGKVTIDGQPASAGRVIFRSADGKSTVFTNILLDGSYRAPEVPYGTMKVTVANLTKLERIRTQRSLKGKKSSASQARAEAIESSPKIPEKYQDPDASGLTYNVQSGTNTYNIEISSK